MKSIRFTKQTAQFYSIDNRIINYENLDQAIENDDDTRHLPPLDPEVVANHIPYMKAYLTARLNKATAEREEVTGRLGILQTKYKLDELGELDIDDYIYKSEKLIKEKKTISNYIRKLSAVQSNLPEKHTVEAVLERYPKLFVAREIAATQPGQS